MTIEPGGGLFSGLYARGPVARATDDHALLQAMLTVELALLRALETCGLAPGQAADQLQAALKSIELDLADLGAGAAQQGTPVPALLTALRERLPEPARSHLHSGATSQDIVDSALMVVARDALGVIAADLHRATTACARLAQEHRASLMAGRTLLQDALPTTFGVKAAAWLAGLHDARVGLVAVRQHGLAAQLGGAVGTLAAYGDRGLEVTRAFAGELGLPEAPLPWHTVRVRPAQLAAALGVAAGVMGKVARDVVLLAQSELGEASEGADGERGGSSTMPHKRNPVAAVAVLACAGQTPGLVASVLSSMVAEHERAAGAWQAEWRPLLSLLTLTGSAADACAELLEGLQVHPERMRGNLEAAGEAMMAESVVGRLAPSLGRAEADRRLRAALDRARAHGRSLGDVLADDDEIVAALGPGGLREALDPGHYLGVADALVGRALALAAS